jgi:predicted lipoprotein with Yx(FWY)xxD motif
LVSLALLAAGCGAATNELNPGREELAVASKASLGTVLVDDEGRTVYLFEKDPPNRSACDGACASVWPPLTTSGRPQAGDGVAAGKLSTIRRSDGLLQVVYAGHPLYYYQADTGRDDAYGQKVSQFGAEWYAVTPSGESAGESGSEGGNGGGGGGGY